MDVKQLKDLVIVPSLYAIQMYSPAAVSLILGTCAQESAMGTYLCQLGIGLRGGLGIYQMEQRTYLDIWDKVIEANKVLKARMILYLGYKSRPSANRLITDLGLATIMCRLHYSRFSEPIPKDGDILGLAEYYKKWYNTQNGSATVEQFMENYRRYVL